METPQNKNGMHWLLVVFVIAAVVVLLATVLNNPSADGVKPAGTFGGDDPQEEPELTPKERTFSSAKPLYFRAVFGQDGTDATLGALDESAGTGTGYNVVYVDENRNGDLTDDAVKKFAKIQRGSRAGQVDPTFKFSGPLKNRTDAMYSLNIYSLGSRGRTGPGDYSFFWTLDTDEWNYFFINGKMKLSSSVAEALTGTPVRLGGQCKWQISSARKSGKAMVSAGLKDENGCTLRLVRRSGRTLSPRLSLLKDGTVELEENMKFG